jgi:hypothetical protein
MGARTALDHAQHVTALAARLAAQLIHEGAHQKNAATADALFGRVQVGYRCEVERGALVDEEDFDAVRPEDTLDLQGCVGLPAVGVADYVIGCLVGGEDDGVGSFLIEPRYLTDRLDEGSRQGQKPQVTREGQGPRRLLGHPVNSAQWIGGTTSPD